MKLRVLIGLSALCLLVSVESGANVLVGGTALFNAEDMAATIRAMREAVAPRAH